MKKSINIVICGDICPTKDTVEYFNNGNYFKIFNDTLDELITSDILIGNLEFPLITNGIGIKKTGPILKGDDHFINVFKDVGFDVLSLANNHIKDCDEVGVINTIKVCKEAGIKTFGAGSNIHEAKKPLIIEKEGWKIGFISFAEHEFNAAYDNAAGANLLDVYSDFDLIKSIKSKVDYLIVLYHGGIEYYRYPSPLLQKKCRKLIESGADFVTCQHSHVIGTEEFYKEGRILYGQGNTVFGYRDNSDSWNEGLIVKINLSIEEKKLTYLPIKSTDSGVFMMNEKEKREVINEMDKRELLIQDENFIIKSWIAFCEAQKSLYLPLFYGKGRVFNKLNRIFNNKIFNLFFSNHKMLISQNISRCESHYEVIQSIFDNNNKSKC